MSKKVFVPEGIKTVGPYSPAVEVDGFIYCSGQIPIDYSIGKLVEGDIEEQTLQCLRNLTDLLSAANAAPEDVVKTTVYLTDINDFSDVNKVYGDYFKRSYPARTAIAVAALPLGSRVEIEAIVKR